jgi:hypothetical protein
MFLLTTVDDIVECDPLKGDDQHDEDQNVSTVLQIHSEAVRKQL